MSIKQKRHHRWLCKNNGGECLHWHVWNEEGEDNSYAEFTITTDNGSATLYFHNSDMKQAQYAAHQIAMAMDDMRTAMKDLAE